jgi:hypothetical protein
MTDEQRRLAAIRIIALDVLSLDASNRDERTEPETRDIVRLTEGHLPRTLVGKQAWAEAGETVP